MNLKKLNILIVSGGWSDEREVSIQSGKNVYHSLKANNYKVEIFDLNRDNVFKIFQKKSVSLKQILLDQRVFVGIGNIYANEALFHCRLDPQRLTNTLTKKQVGKLIQSCRHVLVLSLKNGGSSIKDYKAPDGTLGSFQNMFEVYQRKKVIWKNRTYLVKKIIQNGRSTFFSPTLQK